MHSLFLFPMKKSLFYISLILFIISINSGMLEQTLDWAAGVSWSANIVEKLREHSQAFIVIFFISLYFDVARDDKKHAIYLSKHQFEILSRALSRTPKDTVVDYLSVYMGQEETSNLVDVLFPEKPVFTDVEVKYVLRNHTEDNDKYILNYQIDFTARINEYILIVTQHAFLQNKISAICKQVSDVITVPSMADNHEDFIHQIIDSINLTSITHDLSGQTQESRIVLDEVSSRQKNKILHGIPKDEFNNIVVLRANLPNKDNNITDKRFRLIAPSIEMRKDDHYVYWVADRPMLLRKIEFNADGFSYGNQQKFNLQPTFSNYNGIIPDLPNETNLILNVHNWISCGQGVILSWR